MKRVLVSFLAVILGAVLLTACQTKQSKTTRQLQGQQQATTNAYQQKLTTAQPYPLQAMNDSAERANLRERLVRLNDPHKIGYFYGLTATGEVKLFATIKGKPSSMGSQLSVTQNITEIRDVGNGVVESMGDDGSFGPEECQGTGVFFFTADTNALGEWCGPWAYFDAPIKLATTPTFILGADAKPTSTAGLNNK